MIQGRNAAVLQFQSAIHFKPALYFAEMQALIDFKGRLKTGHRL